MLAKIADTPFDFAVVFMALTAIYGIITSLILFWYPVKQAHNKHLLGISLFAYSWYCLIICLVYSHVIISVPHLFRTSTPLMFLVAPASYLYVRSTINGERQFKRYDWVHVIPFVLVTIDFLPFFLKSSAYKMQDINNYLTHGEVVSALHESILPENLNFIIRVILSILYVSLQWKALIRFLSQASVRVRKKYHVLTGWLLAFTLLITLITINFCVVFIVNAFHIYIPVVRLVFNLLLSIHLLVVIIVLALNPKVLYSFEDNYLFIAQPVHDVSGRNDKVIIIKSAIDHILLQDQCFLKQGYSLSAMPKILISRYRYCQRL